MAFQRAPDRRSILQGLQQTRSRLQRMHSDEPSLARGRSSPPVAHAHGFPPPNTRGPLPLPHGHPHSLTPPTVTKPTSTSPQQLLNAPRAVHSTPSPNEQSYLAQQQKAAMQQAQAYSSAYFISQPSIHGNLLLPVIPRFDPSGQLK